MSNFAEFNAFYNIAPSDELLLMRELKIPTHGSDAETILELQSKLENEKWAVKYAERETAAKVRKIKRLNAQLSAKGKIIAELEAENIRLLAMLQNEREAHEQSRALMEKRLRVASIGKPRETAPDGAQGRKGRTMRDRMLQVSF